MGTLNSNAVLEQWANNLRARAERTSVGNSRKHRPPPPQDDPLIRERPDTLTGQACGRCVLRAVGDHGCRTLPVRETSRSVVGQLEVDTITFGELRDSMWRGVGASILGREGQG